MDETEEPCCYADGGDEYLAICADCGRSWSEHHERWPELNPFPWR